MKSTFQLKPFDWYWSGKNFIFTQHSAPHHTQSLAKVYSKRVVLDAFAVLHLQCGGSDSIKRIGFACSFLCLARGVSLMERMKQIRQCKNWQTAHKAKRYKIHSILCSMERSLLRAVHRTLMHKHMRENIPNILCYMCVCEKRGKSKIYAYNMYIQIQTYSTDTMAIKWKV